MNANDYMVELEATIKKREERIVELERQSSELVASNERLAECVLKLTQTATHAPFVPAHWMRKSEVDVDWRTGKITSKCWQHPDAPAVGMAYGHAVCVDCYDAARRREALDGPACSKHPGAKATGSTNGRYVCSECLEDYLQGLGQ